MAKIFRRFMYSLGFGREETSESEIEHWNVEIDQQQVKVVVIKPDSFGDTKKMATHIKEGRPVIINLEGLSHALSQRIVDYMSGATYSVEGNMQKIGEYIFFFAPSGINIGMESFSAKYKSDSFPFDDLGID
ncbi:MAG: cell division protein SepF [bacterium]|jgi:FtsZ-interacting cell division protein YlmF